MDSFPIPSFLLRQSDANTCDAGMILKQSVTKKVFQSTPAADKVIADCFVVKNAWLFDSASGEHCCKHINVSRFMT